jgi:hypothetical protein
MHRRRCKALEDFLAGTWRFYARQTIIPYSTADVAPGNYGVNPNYSYDWRLGVPALT